MYTNNYWKKGKTKIVIHCGIFAITQQTERKNSVTNVKPSNGINLPTGARTSEKIKWKKTVNTTCWKCSTAQHGEAMNQKM